MQINPPHSSLQFVSVQAAAQMLNVSSSSIQRLCARGVLAFVKTSGGHRRISFASIAEYAKSRKLESEENLKPKMAARQNVDVLSCLVDGIIPQLVFWLKGTAKQVAHRLEDELCGAIYQLDQACTQNSLQRDKLWLAIETARAVLDAYKVELLPEDDSWPVAVGGTMTGNFDWLGTRMVEICMRQSSIRAVGLGNNLLAKDLAQAACDLGAKLVWLSYSHLEDPAKMIQWHQSLAELLPESIEVVIGGGAISPAVRRSIPTHRYFESLSELVDFLKSDFLVRDHGIRANKGDVLPSSNHSAAVVDLPKPWHSSLLSRG